MDNEQNQYDPKLTIFDKFLDKFLPDAVVIKRWVFLTLMILVIGVSVLIILIARVDSNTNRIDAASVKLKEKEGTDIETAREASYRICERGNLTRAEILFTVSKYETENLNMQRAERLPIVDCTPNLDGHAAHALPLDEQKKYIDFYVTNKGIPPIIKDNKIISKKNLEVFLPAAAPVEKGK